MGSPVPVVEDQASFPSFFFFSFSASSRQEEIDVGKDSRITVFFPLSPLSLLFKSIVAMLGVVGGPSVRPWRAGGRPLFLFFF